MRILLSVGNIEEHRLCSRLSLRHNLKFDFLGLLSFVGDESSAWCHEIGSAGDELILEVHSSLINIDYLLAGKESDSGVNGLRFIDTWMSALKDDEPGVCKIAGCEVNGVDDYSLLIGVVSLYVHRNMVSLIWHSSELVLDVPLRQVYVIWLTRVDFDGLSLTSWHSEGQ